MARVATLLVADEVYFNLSGKTILQGIYHADLVIPTDESRAPQLIFFFIAETDQSDAFQSLIAEVTLPGSSPVSQPVQLIWPLPQTAKGTRAFYKHPLLIQNPILRPGRIIAKLLHEGGGEILVGAPNILKAAATN
jgi:hypothetical protein